MRDLVRDNSLIGGYRIAHGTHGDGEPVVLIHGTPSSSYIWRHVVPELVEAGHRVHLFDLLGFGLSERPWNPTVNTSVSGQVPILENLLSLWGLDRTHIVAHDIGGAIAQRFCIFSPQRVKSLTLIDTVSFDSWPSKRTSQQMKAGLEASIKKPDSEHRDHFRSWILSTVHDETRIRAESLETFVEFISGPIGQASFFQHQVSHYDHRHTSELNDRLHELSNMPVQILWGENDAWQVVDWAHRLHAAIPGSTLHILPECGHFAMEDKPAEISTLVKRFLATHTTR
ncbi:MAG: alpha/beta hydrolase [Alphaproteobacteria bacterium]|nr:alpha/beta hydrolase [Alphaproteobacteria bacterium]